ncbi:phenylacetate--CoA ligase [uncultured Mitsuokella sp.]|uniref:phenylacetate--CoA ligase family protein n=1 Tax=uncultured Mitsuokella sp. TaxID=453120 RepID=UPI00262EBC22|nr:phenylacetate--CoA ligase [uncultured Mitsuokella sp.]
MEITKEQLALVAERIGAMREAGSFYGKRLAACGIDRVETAEDFRRLPFSEKKDLRDAYPLGLMSVPEEEIIRIHSSSGTTGKPVIVPYTRKDVEDWAIQFARCYAMAGITNRDRIQITPGYGLWTAGIGFQAGCERLGAMAVPMGPGNTDKQIQMMIDMKSTVLCATSSYALLLAEEIEKRGVRDAIHLKKGIIGSERWGAKMRASIEEKLGIQTYDIYGLTEIYGPGIGITCDAHTGIHYWDDYIYLEIIDPVTGENLPDGAWGEIVITTLRKEGAPLIRFRTHDLSRIIPGKCGCGREYPRIDTIEGRTDDMVKIKGVNLFPSQIEEILQTFPEVSSEYQIHISHLDGKDTMRLYVETNGRVDFLALARRIAERVKSRIGFTPLVKVVEIGVLPRSEKKTRRIVDTRYE